MPSFVRSGSLRANTGAYTDSPVNGLLYVRGTVGACPQLSCLPNSAQGIS